MVRKDLNWTYNLSVLVALVLMFLGTSACGQTHVQELTSGDFEPQIKAAMQGIREDRPPTLAPSDPASKNHPVLRALRHLYWAQQYNRQGAYTLAVRHFLQLPLHWQSIETARGHYFDALDGLNLNSTHSRQYGRRGLIRKLLYRLNPAKLISSQIKWREKFEGFTLREFGSLLRNPAKLSLHLARATLKQNVKQSLRSRRPAAALKQLNQIQDQADKPCWWWYLKLRSLRNLRQWSAAKNHLSQARTHCTNKDQDTPWLSLLGISVLRANKEDAEAKRLAQTLMRDFPKHRLFDDALYKLISIDLKVDDGLNKAYQRASAYVLDDSIGDRFDDAIFKVAIVLFKNQQWSKARQLLSQLCRKPHWIERPGEEGRCKYWLARVISKMGEPVQGLYKELGQQFPYSWYGRLSIQRAGLDSNQAKTLWQQERKRRLEPLRRIRIELKNTQSPVPKVQQFLQDSIRHLDLLITEQSHRVECGTMPAHICLQQRILRLPLSGQLPPNHGDHDRADYFLMPFSESVTRAAESTQVPKSLIWAIMREESHFDPNALSFVGALGLMQLMPGTAKDMSKRGTKITTNRSDPTTNISLGARYLSLVKQYTKTRWTLVPPGYNAGQGSLRRWLKGNVGMELDLFVESIPYDEARSYTMRVNRSLSVYRSLLNQPTFSLLGGVK